MIMTKLKEPEARAAYLALGPSRTLPQLREHFGERAVSGRTFETWSAENDWVALAKSHDEDVTRKAVERLAAQQGKRAADLVTHLITAAAEGLTRAVEIAAKENKFKDLVDGSVTALKAAEVLTGGVSDRIEQHQRMHVERAKAVRKELESILGVEPDPAEDEKRGEPLVH